MPSETKSEDQSCRHEHFDLDILDEEFEIPIDRMFELLFTDSPVFREIHRRRQTYDMVQTPWPQAAEPDEIKVRCIGYTLSINYSVGPKSSPTTERQIIYPESKAGTSYLVDAELFNTGVPYAESFYSIVRYCITRTTTPDRCRVVITSKVCWRKPTWGLFKKFLENLADTEMISSFSLMGELLREEALRYRNCKPRIEKDPLPSNEEHRSISKLPSVWWNRETIQNMISDKTSLTGSNALSEVQEDSAVNWSQELSTGLATLLIIVAISVVLLISPDSSYRPTSVSPASSATSKLQSNSPGRHPRQTTSSSLPLSSSTLAISRPPLQNFSERRLLSHAGPNCITALVHTSPGLILRPFGGQVYNRLDICPYSSRLFNHRYVQWRVPLHMAMQTSPQKFKPVFGLVGLGILGMGRQSYL